MNQESIRINYLKELKKILILQNNSYFKNHNFKGNQFLDIFLKKEYHIRIYLSYDKNTLKNLILFGIYINSKNKNMFEFFKKYENPIQNIFNNNLFFEQIDNHYVIEQRIDIDLSKYENQEKLNTQILKEVPIFIKTFNKYEENYKKTNDTNLNSSIAYNNRGVSKDTLELHDEAILYYDKAIELNSNYADAYNNRGVSKDTLGLYNEAILDYDKAIELNSNYADAYNNRGVSKDTLELHDEAILDYDKAIELNSNYADAYNNRGISKDILGLHEEAILDYDKAIKLNSNYSAAYNNRGVSKDTLGLYNEAILDYDKAIELNSNYADAYNNRGVSKNKLGLYNEAILDYDKAIELDSNYIDAYNNRGISKDILGLHEEAILDYDKAIKLNSNYSTAYNNKGISKNNLGLYDEAILNYNKAIELDSNYIDAYNNRGDLKNNLGLYEEAILDYNKIITLNSNLIDIIQKKEIVNTNLKLQKKKNKDIFQKENNNFYISENYLKAMENSPINSNLKFNIIPKKKKEKKEILIESSWLRDPILAKQAIYYANYKCEYDNTHISFESEVTEKQFMEAHHLIPMNQQENFEYELDTLANIISLCPNCHRMIHHGNQKTKSKIIKYLFNNRKEKLKKSYLNITFEELLKNY